jgi:hypothetical protein
LRSVSNFEYWVADQAMPDVTAKVAPGRARS